MLYCIAFISYNAGPKFLVLRARIRETARRGALYAMQLVGCFMWALLSNVTAMAYPSSVWAGVDSE